MAEAQYTAYVAPKNSYTKKIDEAGKATFYPLSCYVNGAFDVETGYFLVVGDKEKLQKFRYEIGYYKYVKVNLDGEPAFYMEKISGDSTEVAKQLEDLKKSKIDVTITPKYENLEEDEVCKDFVAKGIHVEKKSISFDISTSHMSKLEPYYYGAFYFTNAASFSEYRVKSPGMKVTLEDIVNSGKGYYFVCDASGDEKMGRSLVVRGIFDGKDLMFLKMPEEKNRVWENVFEIPTDIEKYYSLAFFTTTVPTDVTPLEISSTIRKFYENKERLSKDKDAIIFSTR